MIEAIVLALFSGVARTVSRLLNARLAQSIGVLPGTLVNYLGGLATATLACLTLRDASLWSAAAWPAVPAWAWFGGAVGVLFVILCNRATPHLSAFAMTLLMFGGQMVAGLLLDAWQHGGFDAVRVVGALLAGVGLAGTVKLDRGARSHLSITEDKSLISHQISDEGKRLL
ncbi:DMT family transporter [Paludibacterium sp.]|uniref:DMT family transporter n=1 Tax=Paludibacterium sp. TaxID=1917523 RepID=UPI0025E7A6A2|nr:DMT family transporter [Paludibacterium sp.]MBV8647421.1 DMT family transporter [Paludibacterium sp.]